MAKRFLIVLRHAPYERLDAAEAVRHLNGAAACGLDAALILLADGVYLAKAGQVAAAGWTDLAAALGQSLGNVAGAERARGSLAVYVSAADLACRGLGPGELVPGCQVLGDAEAADLLARANATLVY